MGKLELINRVYDKLCDEESKRVYEAKLELIINNDEMKFLDWFISEYKDIRCPELEAYEKKNPNAEYILFGVGKEGQKAYKILKSCGKKVIGWCDNNKNLYDGKNQIFQGEPGILPNDLGLHYSDKTVIISAKNSLPIYQQLVLMGFPREHIIISMNGSLLGSHGNQYFDLFSADKTEKEIFVDAGCWDGVTTKTFVEWCGGDKHYDKIYAFEPDESCWEKCEETFSKAGISNVCFVKKGTWNEKDTLYFKTSGRGSSSIGNKETANLRIQVTSIDEVLNGGKATFIKLDVEGSEMETLIGAQETIRNYKPKLAISVYHKPEDMWMVAEYVMKLNPDYKLYLRHYTTCSYETILYAI